MIESYTLSEASAQLGKSEETIRRWAMAGQFEYTHADTGGCFKVSKPDIDALAATAPEDDLYITPKEASRLLGVSPSGIAKMAKSGKVEGVKWCNNWYILRTSIIGLIDAGYDVNEIRRENGRKSAAVLSKKNAGQTPVDLRRCDPAMKRAIEKRLPKQNALLARIASMGVK